MTKIEKEKRTVRRMIELYCKHHLKLDAMPDEYEHLCQYAEQRLDQCRFGEQKGTCRLCKIHCYAPTEREQIRKVMRWTGPRMIYFMPKEAILHWLQGLSFRTGLIVMAMCIPFYIISFAQMLLPISAATKGVLWVVFFGLAKTCQYGGLSILGVEGFNRVKGWWKRRRGR
ncbi:MAG: nitrous oxide-stimulated promoter family protein [Bacteroidales bacterium]|nr:nitrous oxide-stimulated promoter family protein [Bacteroidales bacterium]